MAGQTNPTESTRSFVRLATRKALMTSASRLPDNKIIEEALRDFKRSVEITRDVRFQANLRLGKRQVASSYIISILSLYVISLSLVPNILLLKPYQNQILLACSIVLSAFIIFPILLYTSKTFFPTHACLHRI